MKSSNLWGWIAVFLIIFGVCVNTAMALSGSGTEEAPWLIQSLADFDEFASDANFWEDYTRLDTDVNLAGRVYDRAVIAWDVNDEENGFQGTWFNGTFDGNGYKVAHLTIDSNDRDYIGLFGGLYGGIRNLVLIDPNIDAGNGGLVGSLGGMGCIGDEATIANCCAEGGSVSGGGGVGGLIGGCWPHTDIVSSHATSDVAGFGGVGVGGLVGVCADYTYITDSHATGNVLGGRFVGGLVGGGGYIYITDSHATGNVTGDSYVGGLFGAGGARIHSSYATGNVVGQDWVGGLVADTLRGEVVSCYATGTVEGHEHVGGLAGENGDRSSVSNCYSTGDVYGVVNVGGLVAYNRSSGSISNSFWDIDEQTHGVTKSIGYDEGGTVTNVLGLPTSQLHQQSTFTDWDFINVWNIGENQTYPYLRTVPAGDINKDKTVNFLDVCIIAEKWCNEE